MARNTTFGFWRQRGTKGGTPAVVPSAVTFSFSPITGFSTGNATGVVLPAGARVIETIVAGVGVTGGTSPTFNIGFLGALTELVANQSTANAAARILVADAPLTEDKEILVGLGTGTAATAGTITATVIYVMDDDGSANS
jgi:hypothetical protein